MVCSLLLFLMTVVRLFVDIFNKMFFNSYFICAMIKYHNQKELILAYSSRGRDVHNGREGLKVGDLNRKLRDHTSTSK